MATKRTSTKTRKSAAPKKGAAKKASGRKAKPAGKPAQKRKRSQPTRDPRVPAVGTVMTRTYKGEELSITVLEDGFEYEGEHYRSLSGLARHIVGYQISGPVFFRLSGETPAAKES
jgi:hypothetical protein